MRIRTVFVSLDYNRFTQVGKNDVKDTISINRMFLLLAQKAATDQSGPLVTGMASEELQFIKDLSFEQIEQLASSLPATGFTLRFKVDQLKRMVETTRPTFNHQYALSVLAGATPR